MKRVSVAAMLFLAWHTTSAWADEVSRYVVPSGFKLVERHDSDSESPGHFARFSGRITLTGLIAVEYERDPAARDGKSGDSPSLYFLPDAWSISRLPRAVGSFYAKDPDVIELASDQ